MDTSDVILCTACFLKVKDNQDILMCSGCRLWQHIKCAPEVTASFYRDFYLSVLRGENPLHWRCNYCSKNTSLVKSLDPPPTSQSDTDSEFSDYDEFALSQEIQRETSDEPAPTTELHNSAYHEDSILDLSFDIPRTALRLPENPVTTRLHNTAYHDDRILDLSFDIPRTAIRQPDNPATSSVTEPRTPPTSLLSATYSLDPSSSDSSDSDDEMAVDTPDTPSTIPYCHSDRSISDSDSEVDFPPPRRVSTAPSPTRHTSVTSLQHDTTTTTSNTTVDREPGYDSDSSSDSSDDDQPDRRVPPFRWGTSSDSSSDSEDDSSPVKKMISQPTLQFSLKPGPVSGGQSTLQDSKGYEYAVKFRIGVNTFWCCTEKQYRCQATAIQNRNIITPGAARHNHTPRAVPQDTAETVKITPTVETQINRFQSLTPDQDKVSGQPPKPTVEMINIGLVDSDYVLVDSNGFVYQEKEISAEAQQTTWRCTKKTKSVKCTGSVRLGCNFLVTKAHNHPGDMKKVTELRVKSKIRACIRANPSKTPSQVINHILLELGLTRQSLSKTGYKSLIKQTMKRKQPWQKKC